MEEHQDKLNGICRLCRKAIKLGQKYVNKTVRDSYKTEILRFFIMILKMMWFAILNTCDNCRRKLDIVKKNSQKEVVTTKIAPFEQHCDKCKFCMKNTWFSELYFFVKYENKVT